MNSKNECHFNVLELSGDLEAWRGSENFVSEYYRNLGIQLRRSSVCTFGAGVPDFYYESAKGRQWIEVKHSSDGLRASQIKWITQNSSEKVTIIIVNGEHILPRKAINKNDYLDSNPGNSFYDAILLDGDLTGSEFAHIKRYNPLTWPHRLQVWLFLDELIEERKERRVLAENNEK